MEALFREILVPVPSGETVNPEEQEQQEGGDKDDSCSKFGEKTTSGEKAEKMDVECPDGELVFPPDQENSVDWANEIEMQRILDSLTGAQRPQSFIEQEFTSVVDLGPMSWGEVEGINTTGVDVF